MLVPCDSCFFILCKVTILIKIYLSSFKYICMVILKKEQFNVIFC